RRLNVKASARRILDIATIEIDELGAVRLVVALGLDRRAWRRQSKHHNEQGLAQRLLLEPSSRVTMISPNGPSLSNPAPITTRFPSLEAFGRRPRRKRHRHDGASSETLHIGD